MHCMYSELCLATNMDCDVMEIAYKYVALSCPEILWSFKNKEFSRKIMLAAAPGVM